MLTIHMTIKTRKKLSKFGFHDFRTNTESFLFLPMVEMNRLLLWNTLEVHQQIMLPWVQCVLTAECIHPIGNFCCIVTLLLIFNIIKFSFQERNQKDAALIKNLSIDTQVAMPMIVRP